MNEAFITLDGDPGTGWLIICDHARNAVPPEYADLGLTREFLSRHIAWDIGAENTSRALARRLGCPLVMSTCSRLLIDLNRSEQDPTLIMRLSDGVVVPGNAEVDEAERQRRISRFLRPYHAEVDRLIDAGIAAGKPPAIISMHSFTPFWKGVPRPWHYAVLWDRDPRLAGPLIEVIEARQQAPVGDNEPYSGRLRGDTMYRHGTVRGLAHALIEVRNDLIATPDGAERAAEFLAGCLASLEGLEGRNEVRHFGSHTDRDELSYEQVVP